MATYREAAWNLSPARLRTAKAARLVYSLIGIPLDALAEGADQATRAGFPDECPEDALPYLGRDRGILRGPEEPAPSFRVRLKLWLEAHRGAGVGRAMLDQIAGYLTPKACRVRIWTKVGVVYTREATGAFRVERAPNGTWDWDGQAALWARFWVILYSVNGIPFARAPRWGSGGTWGSRPGLTWGSSATVAEARSIRSIIDEWKPALSRCQNVLIAFDDTLFAPTDTSPPLPNGTWGEYWDTPSHSANRDRRALYWKGV
jgi:hypothetical protein